MHHRLAPKQIKGTLKGVVGRVVGDAKLQVDGKVQNAVGGIKDTLSGA